MPSTSKKQHNFMAAIAHSPAFAKKVGVSQAVGKDFNKADKGRKFEKGGDTMATKKPFPAGLFGNKESKGEEKAEKKATDRDIVQAAVSYVYDIRRKRDRLDAYKLVRLQR